jgi:hypothetical protein
MTSIHAARPLRWDSVQEGNVGKLSGIRRLMASLVGEPEDPDDDVTELSLGPSRSAEDRLRQQIANEILAEVDQVISAPAHVYARRIAELSAGPADRLFWDGVLEGMLIAADVAGPQHEPQD